VELIHGAQDTFQLWATVTAVMNFWAQTEFLGRMTITGLKSNEFFILT